MDAKETLCLLMPQENGTAVPSAQALIYTCWRLTHQRLYGAHLSDYECQWVKPLTTTDLPVFWASGHSRSGGKKHDHPKHTWAVRVFMQLSAV